MGEGCGCADDLVEGEVVNSAEDIGDKLFNVMDKL
jgi:hypothetical protein